MKDSLPPTEKFTVRDMVKIPLKKKYKMKIWATVADRGIFVGGQIRAINIQETVVKV